MHKPFFDRYGPVAALYTARPHYPRELFDFLAGLAPARELAWDCGCGSGQASHDLAQHFASVIATDQSAAQISLARPSPRVLFRQAAAEISGLDSHSIDLINVGMAVHWFDLPAFYDEARRVTKPGGILALIAYGEPSLDDPCLNAPLGHFLAAVDAYGPPERRMVQSLYTGLEFPFGNEVALPPMHVRAKMTLNEFASYLRSRSAVIDYTKRTNRDPVATLEETISPLLTKPREPVTISWPLGGRVAKIA